MYSKIPSLIAATTFRDLYACAKRIHRRDIIHRTWIMMSFSKENNSMDELVERWLSLPDAYPVCILDHGETIVVLLKKERKKTLAHQGVNEPEPDFWGPATPSGAVPARNYINNIFRSMRLAGTFYSNIDFSFHITDDLVSCVKAEFKSLNPAERQNEISRAKIVSKAQQTPRDVCILKCCSSILAEIKAEEQEEGTKKGEKILADPNAHLSMTSVHDSIMNLQCYYMDPVSYEINSFTIYEFMYEGHASQWSLVLHGLAGMGKTPLAKLICCFLSKGMQESLDESSRYYVMAGTVDGLRHMHGQLVVGTAILLDDVTAGGKQGSRAPITLEQLKHLTNIVGHETLSARYDDLSIPDECTRVFTTNAQSPHEWCNCLPNDIYTLSSAQRKEACSVDAVAILKRVAFCKIDEMVVSQSSRNAFWKDRKDGHRSKMSRIAPVFSPAHPPLL